MAKGINGARDTPPGCCKLGSMLQYSSIGDGIWQRLSRSDGRCDNVEEEFTAKHVSGNVHGEEAHHARSPLLNPLPQAGEEANESLRELHDTGPAAKNPLDDPNNQRRIFNSRYAMLHASSNASLGLRG